MELSWLSNFLDKENVFHIQNYTLIIILAIVVGVIFFLVSIIVVLVRKLRSTERVRYGFGGKTLFSLILVCALTLSIPLTLFATWRSADIRRSAMEERVLVVNIRVVKREEGLYSVSFSAIPFINQEVWGQKDYTILWVVEGEETFEKKETKRDSQHPSYFAKELPSGHYHIRVLATSDNYRIVEERDLYLE